jgi:hypothetical protein
LFYVEKRCPAPLIRCWRRAANGADHNTNERKAMDPQEVTEAPQDRTGSWIPRHDEYTPQALAGGRS